MLWHGLIMAKTIMLRVDFDLESNSFHAMSSWAYFLLDIRAIP